MHGRPPASLLPLLLLISAIQLTQPSPRGEPPFRLAIPEGPCSPGDIVQLIASSQHPIQQLQASFAGEKIIFFTDSKRQQWNALVGIDMQTKPGRHIIRGTVGYQDHTSATFEESLEILPKEFPEERVEVDEEYVTPSAENVKRAEAEAKRLEVLWKTSSLAKLWQGNFVQPVRAKVTSEFGARRLLNNKPGSPHSGVDLDAPAGTPVKAANAGQVVVADELFLSGNTVVIDHGLGLYTIYCHGSKLVIKEGQSVKKGQVIARVGSTGRTTGAHLHWGCRLHGARVNALGLPRLRLVGSQRRAS
jgi:murein DD-endopeptidase MepM/ murein hydrolase activator NlpD